MKMKDNTTPKKIMRRRGRPRKSSSDNSPIRKTRTLRLTEEEVRHITENARRFQKNFSEYCRQVLMGYKPGVPDPELRDGLLAARKDMVNFINNISGLDMTKEERSRFLASMPTIRIWWKALFAEIEWIDKYMKRM